MLQTLLSVKQNKNKTFVVHLYTICAFKFEQQRFWNLLGFKWIARVTLWDDGPSMLSFISTQGQKSVFTWKESAQNSTRIHLTEMFFPLSSSESIEMKKFFQWEYHKTFTAMNCIQFHRFFPQPFFVLCLQIHLSVCTATITVFYLYLTLNNHEHVLHLFESFTQPHRSRQIKSWITQKKSSESNIPKYLVCSLDHCSGCITY